MTGRRVGARSRGLLGVVVVVGAVLAWTALLHAQPADQSIAAILAAKAQRTPVQRKLSSQLLSGTQRTQPAGRATHRQARSAPVKDEPVPTASGTDEVVTVDIRADVTDAILARIRALGGTVLSSIPRYRAIRAHLPLTALEPLARLEAVQFIQPADQAITHQMLARAAAAQAVVTASKVNTTEGDKAHQADVARRDHSVDGTGISIGVISDGVVTLADQQETGDVPARVTVLPGQEGGAISFCEGTRKSSGTEGTAIFEIVHDLAPGAELFFSTGITGSAQMAQNIEDLCTAGADIIVDDLGYLLVPAFQDGVIAQAVSAAVANGCYYFSSAGNSGNLNDGTSGLWEGDFAAGSALSLSGVSAGAVYHDFGGGVTGNRIVDDSIYSISLQWADPWGESANDYDLFLIDADDKVLDSSTNTQDGTQNPIEYIYDSSCSADREGARLVIVKNAGAADRYLRLNYTRGELAIATAGQTSGHSASQNAIGVAAVSAQTAGGDGDVFNGTESVETFSSDGPRRIFFDADGTPITPGNFSSTGGRVLDKPDLTAADGVSTSTPGFSRFYGTSAAAPHAAAIAALVLEAAGGPAHVTQDELRTALTGSALDIEAMGVDRDSGAGIVMAPGAVDAVDVAVADRNRAPTVTSTLTGRTLAPGADAVTIDLEDIFDDPNDDTLTYTMQLRPDTPTVTRNGSQLTLAPAGPSPTVVVTVRATDPDGLTRAQTFSVAVTAGNQDYDVDNDKLIDVSTLAQLDAIRYDLNGDGWVDGATWQPYYAAFDQGAAGMGCPDGCVGYELTADLDFDTNDSGGPDAGDDYWNAGDGWAPIGTQDAQFEATFAGNDHALAKLFINRPAEDRVGLFGYVGRDNAIRDIGLADVDVTGRDQVGSLTGQVAGASIERSYATGRVTGEEDVGGLVGWTGGPVLDSYAAVRVSGVEAVGGLVGTQDASRIASSYATGPVSGSDAVGGLVGNVFGLVQTSYATGPVLGQGTRPTGCGETGGVGGLAGNACGQIEASYATGTVFGETAVGGLVGSVGTALRVRASYWDLTISGLSVGVGADDVNDSGAIDGGESRTIGVTGQTMAALQVPTSYDGIYRTWNLDLNGDSIADDPWHFGTTVQYPALRGSATWQEFGYQLRAGPTLTAIPDQDQVTLSWPAVVPHWTPPPQVTYTVYRDDGASVEALATDIVELQYTDSDVTTGATYTYQVAAVVTGGQATRSGLTTVTIGEAPPPHRPPPGPASDPEPAPEPEGVFENPGPGSHQSGIGLLSGWVCAANVVELEINGMQRVAAAYGTDRADTATICGDTNNGFGLLFNWNLLGDGMQMVRALADGVEFGQATFTVTTLGEEFVADVTAETLLEDFPSPGERVRLVWQPATQNFVLAPLDNTPPPASPSSPAGGPRGALENPGPASFQSGLGLLSGWVCAADVVELEINGGPRIAAAYGTDRADTAEVCGDADNGFGLLFNWNLLGDGVHTAVALADGDEFGRATFTVTTLGVEFLRGSQGEIVVPDFPSAGETARLVWQPATQNFVLAPPSPETADRSGQ